MGKGKHQSRGFTLIAALLLLLLLSGVAVGLMFLVNGQGRIGSNDLEANEAYYGAESGMEKLTADLAALYQLNQAPTPGQITALANNPPTSAMINGMNYQESITWQQDQNGNPVTHTSVISSGVNAGLAAEIIPMTLSVTANRPGGASVNMTRGVEVALIPVFQFGVFSDTDLSYFAGPKFDFQGRVHTNGNLFLAADPGPLIVNAKVTAVGEVMRDRLANGYSGGANYQGDVYVPNATGGCDLPGQTSNPNCLRFTMANASCSGMLPPCAPANQNSNWPNTSKYTFNGFIGNANSLGVTPLQLPFVAGGNNPIEIIRKGKAGDSTALAASREYNKANIRVLLADSLADLHPERGAGALDAEDVDLTAGGPGVSPNGLGINVTGVGTTRFAMAKGAGIATEANWRRPFGGGDPWNLINGWLRVEYKDTNGNWVGITNQWLRLGFARGITVPTAPAGNAGANNVHPNAILVFQEQADRNADNAINNTDNPRNIIDGGTFSNNSWYPINFYDPREGFPRDVKPGGWANSACYANGIMNAVELDVGNLNNWLQANGNLIQYQPVNGFLLYFSDRRGQVMDPNLVPAATTGRYGFEDVINSNDPANGMPDNQLEPIFSTGFSPEDVDQNRRFDNWGSEGNGSAGLVGVVNGFANLATAPNPNINPPNPFQRIDCVAGGRQNIVMGARHVLRLVDGGLGRLPVRLDNGLGGFTVASENPVYVYGNYNSDSTDPFWGNPNTNSDIPHAAAAIIADAVTLLSNGFSDLNSMQNASNRAGRTANTTYYRMAIAAGKNMNFPGNTAAGWPKDFGTDGGVHNFLRYIQDWSGNTLYYRGSLVSLYYAQYANSVYKCCTMVYSPPSRKYYFDNAFLNPANLPPGTPMFQDIVNLSYWQNFAPY